MVVKRPPPIPGTEKGNDAAIQKVRPMNPGPGNAIVLEDPATYEV